MTNKLPTGGSIYVNPVALTAAQADVVEALEATLEQARRGVINAVGIVSCFKNDVATMIGGFDMATVNLGCDIMKDAIKERLRAKPQEEVAPSSIIRVGRA